MALAKIENEELMDLYFDFTMNGYFDKIMKKSSNKLLDELFLDAGLSTDDLYFYLEYERNVTDLKSLSLYSRYQYISHTLIYYLFKLNTFTNELNIYKYPKILYFKNKQKNLKY